MPRKKSNCLHCNVVFEYNSCRSTGTYCSNKCQGQHKRQILIDTGKASTRSVRNFILENWEYKCSKCGITDWNGKHIPLHMDHIDGNNKNNVLSNVRWLCPNCHQQTDTWGAKNISDENRERLKTNKRQ